MKRLTAEKALAPTGQTRNRAYKLCSITDWHHTYRIQPGLAEDVVWREDIAQFLGDLPENVKDIWVVSQFENLAA